MCEFILWQSARLGTSLEFRMAFDYTDYNYDINYASVDDMRQYGPMARHVRRLIFQVIGDLSFGSILDVSCGGGELLSEMAMRYPAVELAGTEYSRRRLEAAAQRIPRERLYQLDLVTEALNRQFDLVVCSEVLEHIADDHAAIANLRRMTRRYLLVTTIQGPFYEYERQSVGHVRSYTRADLEGKIQEAGFRIVRTIEWGWPFYSPIYRGLLALMQARGTTGTYGTFRKLVAWVLYVIFLLNSHQCGDELVVLAEIDNK